MKIEDVRMGMRVKSAYGEGTVESPYMGKYFWVKSEEKGDCRTFIFRPDEFSEISVDDYTHLRTILDEAITRASEGKGKDRHANGKPFDEQPIIGLNLSLGSQDGCLFQIQKKCAEASRFYASGEQERAENELLDCIVYAAGAVITGRKRK